MIESLSLTYADIRQQVGDWMGYGVTVEDWQDDTEKSQRVALILKEGATIFYTAHAWSFLSPVHEFTIASGAEEYLLPAEFGHFTDQVYFADASVNFGRPLSIQNDGQVFRARQQNPTSTGIPLLAAEVPIAPTSQQGSRKKLIFWPTANQAYAMEARYSVTPAALSVENPYPYGGAVHAVTILHSCLAVAERKDGMMGVNAKQYQQSLALSIENDNLSKARSIAAITNRHRDRHRGYGREWPWVGISSVTYTP